LHLYTLSFSRFINISGGHIIYLYKKYKNKKFLDANIVTMHFLQKKFMKKILVLVFTQRNICSLWNHDKKDVGSTFSSNNIYRVVDDNNNNYKSMIIDAILRMNQGYASEYSIVDEKPNADTTRFLNF